MNAIIVGKPLGMIHPLLNIREFILEKNLLGVMNVGRLSVEAPLLFNIVSFTQERNLTSVMNVEKPSVRAHS